jgi:excisionase family DNA binding protein
MRTNESSDQVVLEASRNNLTRADVARLLGVSPNTVTRWAREGRLPCQLTLGGHHRFDRAVIEEIRDGLCRGVAR